MANCSGCGAESARVRRTMTYGGKLLAEDQQTEICPHCHPEEFSEPFDPFGRIATGPEAMPHMYTRDAEGVYHAKDELMQDTADRWNLGETAKRAIQKRKTRRTEPLSPAEMEASKQFGQQLAPIYREHAEKERHNRECLKTS